MHTLFADETVSMSEFKKNPAAVLREAGSGPVAVLNHNAAAFYMIRPALMQAICEALDDINLSKLVRRRLSDGAKPVAVDLDDL
jgi:antitoxin StbD